MKIFNNNEPIKTSRDKRTTTKKSDAGSEVSSKDQTFLDILESIVPSTNENTREINEYWQLLPDAERSFLREPSSKNLEAYKALIKNITNAILKRNVQLVQARQRGRNDKKVLMTVKIIDENIQILARTMLSPNNSAFHLLKQMEKIRGLLLDLQK